MQELSIRDETAQEYEREVIAQAKGAVELDICDVLAAAEDELRAARQRISAEHNGRRVNVFAGVLGKNLARELAGHIYDSYMFKFDSYVSNEDAEDKILNDEYAVDEVRKHTLELLRKLQVGR